MAFLITPTIYLFVILINFLFIKGEEMLLMGGGEEQFNNNNNVRSLNRKKHVSDLLKQYYKFYFSFNKNVSL